MGPIAYLADLTLEWGVIGSTEEFEFSGVGSIPIILEIRGLNTSIIYSIKVTLLSDIFLVLRGDARDYNGGWDVSYEEC